jgi:hypothetical protein
MLRDVRGLKVGQKICYSSRSDGMDCIQVESGQLSAHGEMEIRMEDA